MTKKFKLFWIIALVVIGFSFTSCSSSSSDSTGSDGGDGGDSPVGTWTVISTVGGPFGVTNINGIAYGGGTFIAVGDNGKIACSPDGINWTPRTISALAGAISCIAYGDYSGGVFVAVGVDAVGDIAVAYSTDKGLTWTKVTGSTLGMTYKGFGGIGIGISIAYGEGVFVAVGANVMEYSNDGGRSWTAVGDTKFGSSDISNIAYGGGKFVAVGEDAKTAYSTNGSSWTAGTVTPFVGTPVELITSIVYVEGKFVAVGYYGNVAYSTDGITWTKANTNYNMSSFIAIAYGGGKFVAVGLAYTGYSTNGIDWTFKDDTILLLGDQHDLYGIAYGGGRFVAVGYRGNLMYSSGD